MAGGLARLCKSLSIKGLWLILFAPASISTFESPKRAVMLDHAILVFCFVDYEPSGSGSFGFLTAKSAFYDFS